MPGPSHLFQRNGVWYFKAEVAGRRFRKSLETRDAGEARRLAKLAYRRALKEAHDARSPDPTVARFAKTWLAEYVTQERRPQGLAMAEQRLRDYILPVTGHLRLSQVLIPQARQVRLLVEARGVAPRTVRHVLSDLRCLLRYAQESNLLLRVPAVSKVFPDIPPDRPDWLTDDELAAILAAASLEHQLMIRLAVGTMLRWSEQVALRRDWIVRKPYPRLLLPSSKRKNKTGEVEEVPLFPETEAALDELMALHTSVFVQRVRGKNPCNLPARIGRRAGVAWHWHQLRHTGGRLLREMGLDLQERQRLMRHSTPLLTVRYSDVTGDGLYRRMLEVSGQSAPQPASVLKRG